MSEAQKIKCRDCTELCSSLPICDEMIEASIRRGDKQDIDNFEKALQLKAYLVQCKHDGVFYFVRAY